MHRNHPAAGDPVSAILYDDCERCDEQAADPRLLDNSKLLDAYRRSMNDDWSGTKNEYKLLDFMYRYRVLSDRLTQAGVHQ